MKPKLNTFYQKELERVPNYTPEQLEKLDKINRSLGKFKRKTLSAKELSSIAAGRELSAE